MHSRVICYQVLYTQENEDGELEMYPQELI